MQLQQEHNRIFALNEEGRLVAEITFPETQPGLYTIDHTFVDASLRGQGMADRLVRAALEQIRAADGAAQATCSYAAAWMEKNCTAH